MRPTYQMDELSDDAMAFMLALRRRGLKLFVQRIGSRVNVHLDKPEYAADLLPVSESIGWELTHWLLRTGWSVVSTTK